MFDITKFKGECMQWSTEEQSLSLIILSDINIQYLHFTKLGALDFDQFIMI